MGFILLFWISFIGVILLVALQRKGANTTTKGSTYWFSLHTDQLESGWTRVRGAVYQGILHGILALTTGLHNITNRALTHLRTSLRKQLFEQHTSNPGQSSPFLRTIIDHKKKNEGTNKV